MRRWLILVFALVLPLQFAWASASAYCQHESGEQQSQHFGHHFHAHKGEAKKAADNKFTADADCGSCHASCSVAIAALPSAHAVAAASPAAKVAASPPFSSALARAPDRPQWLRLV